MSQRGKKESRVQFLVSVYRGAVLLDSCNEGG